MSKKLSLIIIFFLLAMTPVIIAFNKGELTLTAEASQNNRADRKTERQQKRQERREKRLNSKLARQEKRAAKQNNRVRKPVRKQPVYSIDKSRFYNNCKAIYDRSHISNYEKIKIINWLQMKSLNCYGDPKNRIYAGGTPLFNELTGERIDAYTYLVKNHPGKPWLN